MDFTIANLKLLLCVKNVSEISILCRFFKFYVIHLSNPCGSNFYEINLILKNLNEKERSNYK